MFMLTFENKTEYVIAEGSIYYIIYYQFIFNTNACVFNTNASKYEVKTRLWIREWQIAKIKKLKHAFTLRRSLKGRIIRKLGDSIIKRLQDLQS